MRRRAFPPIPPSHLSTPFQGIVFPGIEHFSREHAADQRRRGRSICQCRILRFNVMHIDEPRVRFRAEFRDFRNFINNILFLLLSSIFFIKCLSFEYSFSPSKICIIGIKVTIRRRRCIVLSPRKDREIELERFSLSSLEFRGHLDGGQAIKIFRSGDKGVYAGAERGSRRREGWQEPSSLKEIITKWVLCSPPLSRAVGPPWMKLYKRTERRRTRDGWKGEGRADSVRAENELKF